MVKQPVAALVTGKTFRGVQYALVARDGLPFPISERLLIGMCGDGMGSRVKHRLRSDKSAGIVRQRESADSRTAQTGQVSADAKFFAEVRTSTSSAGISPVFASSRNGSAACSPATNPLRISSTVNSLMVTGRGLSSTSLPSRAKS